MEIRYSRIMACFMPVFRLLHILVPYEGKRVPVKVNFRSEMNSDIVHIQREFNVPGIKPYAFNSHLHILGENDVIEGMGWGMGWRMHYFFDGQKVVMAHKGYVLRLWGFNIPLPLSFFVGKSYAEEVPINDNTYRVNLTMTHAWFGLMYYYSGVIILKEPVS